jgi:hypothetical protein
MNRREPETTLANNEVTNMLITFMMVQKSNLLERAQNPGTNFKDNPLF